MFSLIKLIPLFYLFNWCGPVMSNDCPQFFQGAAWPRTKDLAGRDAVRLCQTQLHGGRPGKVVFATLFSTADHIPVYSANAVVLKRNVPGYPRPDHSYWDRVATTLCNIYQLPSYPIPSNLDFAHPQFLPKCRQFQAISYDYTNNRRNLDRGHLSPSHINNQDQEKIYGTFTLTNAAPQYNLFNCNSWNQYECVTRQAILDFVPGEKVYIITGTFGSAGWMNGGGDKNPVKIPKYYYKAFCYPGNPGTRSLPWGYAIVKENVNKKETADYGSYITLNKFAQTYFIDPPFGPECMRSTFGPFATIFNNWKNYLQTNCPIRSGRNQEC